jgi:cytidylate kinase
LGENLKLKSKFNIQIAADGSSASGKTTGARLFSKKYGIKFLSSGLLYRYSSYLIIKNKPSSERIFLEKKFKKFNLSHLKNKNLHTPEISELSSKIAKKREIRGILKRFQKNFVRRNRKVCIEGRDIGTVIMPNADIKFFFTCNLNTAAKRRFKDLKKKNPKIKFAEVKKAMRIRDNLDRSRRISPLIKPKNAVIVPTDKLKNIKGMINKMSNVLESVIKKKYGS